MIARAGFPIPEPPIPQRVALADAIVVGQVAKREEPVEAFPLLRVRGGPRVSFQMALVRVDRVLLGEAGLEQVRVGIGPGRAMPTLTEGQQGCFFLHKHPEGPFSVLSAGSDFIDSRHEDFGRGLALAGRCTGLLANTDEGLRSRNEEDRLLTAALLIFRFRTVQYAYAGAPRTEPIDAELSRRILAVLAEGPFSDKSAREPADRLTLFLRLGLTEEDGWALPPNVQGTAAAAEKWLGNHAATYRIRRYVPEESMPSNEDQGPPAAEQRTWGGPVVRGIETAIRRRPWMWLSGALVCVLAVVGCAIYRQVWAEIHYRRAEEALTRSVRSKGPAPLAEARNHLACCLKVWPNNPRVNFLMAQAARRAGDPDEAARCLRRAEQLGWVAEAIDLEKALAAVQQGDLERLEPVLASFVQRDHPDKLLILEALVQGSRRTYQLARALAYLDTWLGFQPDSVRALVWRGETLLLVGRNQDALADYRKAIELDPQEDEARLKVAELFLAAHQPDEASTHFTELLHRHPDQCDALLGLARCRVEEGNTAEAVDLLDQLLSLQPEHGGALAERGKIALDAGSPVDAEEWLRRAARVAPFERETLYNLYRCLTRNGHTREAEDCLARIQRIDKDRKRLDELKTAVMAAPHDASLRCEMGVILLRNGQDKEGVRWIQSALHEQPGYDAARQALEDYYRRPTGADAGESVPKE
ncbi:MAG TPA: tetratricopeptide repeat protein [Gemmataceae bacterium]|nr:tetratricopeptide repeat protein [Gemmataceae bacterium]